MINSKEDLKIYLAADKIALSRKRKRPRFDDYIWKFEIYLRYCEYYRNCKKGFFSKIIYLYYAFMKNRLGVKCGFTIHPNCFGKGLSISHCGTIIVNSAARVGDNCRLHACVNIGTKAGYDNVAPVIGDNVYIGPGAKIFGDIHIADNVVIGANAVVCKSFLKSDVTIAGVPANVIKNSGRFSLGPSENKKYEHLCKLIEQYKNGD